MNKKKTEPGWEVCSCGRHSAPKGTRCDICLTEEYLKGIDIHYCQDDEWTELPLLDEELVLDVIRKMDTKIIELKKKLDYYGIKYGGME